MSKPLNNYPTFNDITNPALQAWNRNETLQTIYAEHGAGLATQYAQQFEKPYQLNIVTIQNAIMTKGKDFVHAAIVKEAVV